jgi:hypothetical protein
MNDPRLDVIDAVNRLFIATDRRDWEGVRHAFADRVSFDMTSMAGGEPQTLAPADIAGAWESGLKPIQAIHHQSGNFRIEIAGDRAKAFCYGIAYHYRPTKSGRNTRVFVGSYDFGLLHGAGGWKIDSFKFDLKFIDGNPALEQE